ncbi:MAG: hypothetical protein E8D43_00420 [Nitrospira sp.]|nr:MAG: hypothetical protein E8D43_00420 [Nitrospira sp.]
MVIQEYPQVYLRNVKLVLVSFPAPRFASFDAIVRVEQAVEPFPGSLIPVEIGVEDSGLQLTSAGNRHVDQPDWISPIMLSFAYFGTSLGRIDAFGGSTNCRCQGQYQKR